MLKYKRLYILLLTCIIIAVHSEDLNFEIENNTSPHPVPIIIINATDNIILLKNNSIIDVITTTSIPKLTAFKENISSTSITQILTVSKDEKGSKDEEIEISTKTTLLSEIDQTTEAIKLLKDNEKSLDEMENSSDTTLLPGIISKVTTTATTITNPSSNEELLPMDEINNQLEYKNNTNNDQMPLELEEEEEEEEEEDEEEADEDEEEVEEQKHPASLQQQNSNNNKNNNINNSSSSDNNSIGLAVKPENCAGRKKLTEQPINSDSATLRKCCPPGESIHYGENGKKEYCDTTDTPFNPIIIDVSLFHDCIEDNEKNFELEIETGNPCNVSLVYSQTSGDELFIIQNGSLLIMDQYGNESFEIRNEYCLDADYNKNAEIFAIVCVATVDPHLDRGQTIVFAISMIISIPCLMLVSFFHFAIRRLRTMHGLCLGFLSSCLAMGFLLHSIAQLSDTFKTRVGYAVQYFMLSYFMWLLMLCSNVIVVVWYYLPRYIRLSRFARYTHLGIYSIIAQSIPFCIVLLTRSKGLQGMPSYFLQAWSESIQSSQRYFIPPVTTILILCFIMLIIAYFGFRKLDQMVETRRIFRYRALNRSSNSRPSNQNNTMPTIDLAMLEETKQDAKCITYLGIIILTTWIMEIVTFYSPGNDDYLAIMEIINGLQGVFILIFFIGVRHRRDIIVRWWHDRGSLGITEVEMQNLKKNERA